MNHRRSFVKRSAPLALVLSLGLMGACSSQDGTSSGDDVGATDEAALGASVTATFQNGVSPTTAYAGTTDTSLSQATLTANDGAGVTLTADMDSPSGSRKAVDTLLRFDLGSIPTGSTVQAVKLKTNVTNRTSGQGYSLHALKRAWSESQATWSSASSGVAWGSAGARGAADRDSTVLGTFLPTAAGTYALTLDAAGVAVVQGWVKTPASNFGFVLDGTSDADGAQLDSSEAATKADRPALSVTYAAPSLPGYPYGAYGTYKPGPSTTGVRAGTKLVKYTNQLGPIVDGTLTLSTPNVKISGYDIPAYVYVKASGITIDNCLVRGPAKVPASGGRQLISAFDTHATNLTVQDSTLVPDAPDHDVAGMQGKSFLAQRNNVYNVVDGIDPLNDGAVILANYIHDLAWFTPDSNHSDNHTHNDCVQFEGGSATVRYNNLEGFLSRTVGQGPTRPFDQSNSAILIAFKTTPLTTNVVVTDNWIDGGGVAVNVGIGSYSNLGTISNNVFGDNQYFKPTTILLNNPRASIGLTLDGNVYHPVDRPLANSAHDGTAVALGNGVHGG